MLDSQTIMSEAISTADDVRFLELRGKFSQGGSPDPTYGICARGDLDFSNAKFDVAPEDLVFEDDHQAPSSR
jgi:hypothetical protein